MSVVSVLLLILGMLIVIVVLLLNTLLMMKEIQHEKIGIGQEIKDCERE
jgi:hypothetical protein